MNYWLSRYKEEDAYLSQLKTVVYLVLERSHLYLADQFGFDVSISKDSREQFMEVRKDDVDLVVDRRVKRHQGESVVAKVIVTEHVHQQRDNQRPQHITVGIAGVRESVTESGNDNSTDGRIFVGEIVLNCKSVKDKYSLDGCFR